MNTPHIRTAAARRCQQSLAVVALAASLAACTTVTRGTVVMGDLGPCTHVNAPMVDIPTSGAERGMRIPEPQGWAHSTELAGLGEGFRFALASTDLGTGEAAPNVAAVIVEAVPGADADADAQTIFDTFQAGFVEGLAEEGLPTDLTTTTGTLCGLPSATLTPAGALPGNSSAATMLVVVESGGDTYLVAVVQTGEPDNPKYQHDAETILMGFEVLPQTETAALRNG